MSAEKFNASQTAELAQQFSDLFNRMVAPTEFVLSTKLGLEKHDRVITAELVEGLKDCVAMFDEGIPEYDWDDIKTKARALLQKYGG